MLIFNTCLCSVMKHMGIFATAPFENVTCTLMHVPAGICDIWRAFGLVHLIGMLLPCLALTHNSVLSMMHLLYRPKIDYHELFVLQIG
jgi:uncharacterized membrane protein